MGRALARWLVASFPSLRHAAALEAARDPRRLPPELALSIGAIDVTFRWDRQEHYSRTYVELAGVGSFELDGLKGAAAKIRAAWPELTEAQARHAAELLAGEVARRQVVKDLRERRADKIRAEVIDKRGDYW